jgi:hypothetical protein
MAKAKKKITVKKKISGNQRKATDGLLRVLSSAMVSRSALAAGLGDQFGGDRNIYESCGYKEVLTFQDFEKKFKRMGIADRIVKAYPDATWKGMPEVIDDEDENNFTDFEKEWKLYVKRLKLRHYFRRLDIISGIGEYGVLFLGFNDVKKPEDMQNEPSGVSQLLYVKPYSQTNATIHSTVNDPSDPRYGLPEIYKLKVQVQMADSEGASSRTHLVHWKRVIHVAEELEESDVYGTPRLQKIFNNLYDVQKIAGGSGEMFWRGGFPGYSFEKDPEYEFDQTSDAIDDEIENYIHGLSRFLKLEGVTAKPLSPQVANPKEHFDIQMKLISAQSKIPVRILLGSERGELASSQDQQAWYDRVAERRENFAEAVIVRAFIDRLISVGAITAPASVDDALDGDYDYRLEWPPLIESNEKETSEIVLNVTKALAEYIKSGADQIVPPEYFLTDLLGWDSERVQEMMKSVEEYLEQEREEAEAAGLEEPEEEIDIEEEEAE